MNLIDTVLATASPQQEQRVHDRMMLAARIADALVAKGWTQKELAAQLQKQPSEISKWLSGTHNFTIDTLSDLSRVLGVRLLCVKEEEPKIEIKHVTRYQTILVRATNRNQASDMIPLSHFQKGIGQGDAVPLRSPQYDA